MRVKLLQFSHINCFGTQDVLSFSHLNSGFRVQPVIPTAEEVTCNYVFITVQIEYEVHVGFGD